MNVYHWFFIDGVDWQNCYVEINLGNNFKRKDMFIDQEREIENITTVGCPEYFGGRFLS